MSLAVRVVTKGRGPGAGDFPRLLRAWPPATFVVKLNQTSTPLKHAKTIHQTIVINFGGPEFKSRPDRLLDLFLAVPSSNPRSR